MKTQSLWKMAPLLIGGAAIAISSGCKGAEDDEYAPAVRPKAFAFTGKQDAKFAGKWRTADGDSTVEILKDGNLNLQTVSHSQSGKSVSDLKGQWLVDGSSLLFQYSVDKQPPTTLKYTATLAGDTLTLVPDGGKVKTVYKRTK